MGRDLRKYSGLRCACITGGADKGLQLEALAKWPHIVAATPGRLLDLVQEGSLPLGEGLLAAFFPILPAEHASASPPTPAPCTYHTDR